MNTPRSTPDWILEAVSAVTLAAAIGDVALHWRILPQRIPIHFGASGDPNGWGDKNMLLLLLSSTIGMAILLTIAETRQRLINVPLNVDRDSPQVRSILRSMAIVMKAVIILAFFWITDATMRTALGEAHGLGRAFLPLFLGGTLAPAIYYAVKLKRLPRK
jgi:uncharacterized membrane protein